MSPITDIRDIPVAQLIVDHDVQRSLDRTRVDRMARDYQSNAIGVLVVSQRDDGTLHTIDGQHRAAATVAAGYGDRWLTCLVYKGLDRSDEAAMFRHLNNTRGVHALDRFRVRVVEGDLAAVRLNQMLNRHGWVVTQSKDDGAFAAVAALDALYRGVRGQSTENLVECETVIQAVTGAWGHNADGVRAELIAGIGAVVMRHGAAVDLTKLVSELAQYQGGPLALVGKAKGLRDIRGGRIGDALAEIVVTLLNKSRRSSRLPAWSAS